MNSEPNKTNRVTSEALDSILGKTFPVLDHGFVRPIDYMGTDSSVVQAARVSYGAGTKSVKSDNALIRYLLSHRHTSPFEMCEIKFHIKLPIFIARQWVRHRTANLNEYSARYSIMDKDYYIPDIENISTQSTNNKQGRGEALSPNEAKAVQDIIKLNSENAYGYYMELINSDSNNNPLDPELKGIAREIARSVLPLNMYTEFYWKIDLHNLLHFLSLRMHKHAQYEIREYATTIANMVKLWMPNTYQAFEDYRLGMVELSKQAVYTIKKVLAGEEVLFEDSGLTKREWEHLQDVFEIR